LKKRQSVNDQETLDAITKLDPQRMTAIELHYGVRQFYYYSYAVVGERLYNVAKGRMGVTKNRAYQICKAAVKELAVKLNATEGAVLASLMRFRKAKLLRTQVDLKEGDTETRRKAARRRRSDMEKVRAARGKK
jgi:hypothetical protein